MSPTTTTQPVEERQSASRVLRIAAGAALVAGPALWAAGMWTSPPAAGTTDIDYITSLGRDGTITQVSALFLHYGNLFIGLGVLAAASLVRGPKGSRLTVIGSLLTALGFTNVSGMLLSDWWNLSAAQNLPIEQAAKVFGGFKDSSLLFLWNGFEMASLLGTILLLVGLARAGVLAWWNLAIFVGRLRGSDLHPVGPAEALRRRGAGRLLPVRDDRCPAVPAGGDRPPLTPPTGHS